MNRMFRAAALLAVLAAVVVGGCNKKPKEDVLYQVGSNVITQDDVQKVLRSFPENVQYQYMGRKGMQQLLDNMVALELLYQESLKQKLDQDPDIKFNLERARKNYLAQTVVERSVKIEDLYAYYQDNFVRIKGIRFKVDDNQNAEQKNAAKAKADEAYKKLIGGEDFRKVKAQYNEGEAAEPGYVSRDDLISSYGTDAATAVFNLKKGNPKRFTDPIFTADGWYIFLVLEYPQNLDPKGYDGVWEEIVNSKREEIFRGLITDLRNKTKVTPNQEAIDKLLKFGTESEKEGQAPAPEAQPAPAATAGNPLQPGQINPPEPGINLPGAPLRPGPFRSPAPPPSRRSSL